MGSIFRWIHALGPTGLVLKAIAGSLFSTGLLLAFILLRRAYRQRYFRRRDALVFELRKCWQGILSGVVPPETWRFDSMKREVVETIFLDSLDVAAQPEASRLRECLVTSGLLDHRIFEARRLRGWRRRRALVSLGRMRAPEAIPALAEALADPHPETRLAAIRGLERTALPEAAVPILDAVLAGSLQIPAAPLQNALFSCCQTRPTLLLPYLRHASEEVRPILARVLAELATPELGDDLLLLAADPVAEVRASAARALGEARPQLALPVLSQLAGDSEWFVRLRAVASLGALQDPQAIPVLIEALCDANRNVRLRAAAALVRLESHLGEILERALETHDRYARDALVSELERSGALQPLLHALTEPGHRRRAGAVLLRALRAGTQRLLLDALASHSNWRVRLAVARLLAESGDERLIPGLQALENNLSSAREQRVVRWVLRRLRGGARGVVSVAGEPEVVNR